MSARPILTYCAPWPVNTNARLTSADVRTGFEVRDLVLVVEKSSEVTENARQSIWLRRDAKV